MIRWAVREGLESAGHDVVEAGTARQAAAALRGGASGVSVALLDLKLPDSGDLSLLHRILAAAPSCRVIMMTAHGAPEILAQAVREGAFGTIAKPFDLTRIVGMVEAAASAA